MKFKSNSPQETIAFAKQFSRFLQPGDIVCLQGNLGAGKTTYVKGIARGLNVSARAVNSPTFVLMNCYEGKCPIYHFDLYRITDKDLENLGCDEFFYGQGIAIIEWAERLGEYKPKGYFSVELTHTGETARTLTVKARGKSYRERLKAMESD